MILVDTSVWIDHFRSGNTRLQDLLGEYKVLVHPHVIGELSLGNIKNRHEILSHLKNLPVSVTASESEVLFFTEKNRLMGMGIGYVDAHLLAAAALSANTRLWTLERRLAKAAGQLGLQAV